MPRVATALGLISSHTANSFNPPYVNDLHTCDGKHGMPTPTTLTTLGRLCANSRQRLGPDDIVALLELLPTQASSLAPSSHELECIDVKTNSNLLGPALKWWGTASSLLMSVTVPDFIALTWNAEGKVGGVERLQHLQLGGAA